MEESDRRTEAPGDETEYPGMVESADLLAEAVVDTIPVPLLLLDADFFVRLANRSFYRLFHVTPQETLGRLLYDIGDKQWDTAELRRMLTELLPSERGFEDFEFEHTFPAIGRKTLLLSARKLRRRETQEHLILLAIGDLTQRKALENLLRESNEDLRQFATVAAHDLQAPLRSAGAFAEVLVRRYGDKFDAEASEYLEHIVQGVASMRKLVTHLLDYARAGAQPFDGGPAASSEALRQALANLSSDIEASGATFVIGDLPVVRADPEQLTQVFQNLLSNALQYRKADSPPSVRISAERRGDNWVFEVSDTGVGFSNADAELIFKPFRRLHGKQQAGSGLGLSICRRIVERSGGEMGARSEPGAGSIFWFSLPAAGESS